MVSGRPAPATASPPPSIGVFAPAELRVFDPGWRRESPAPLPPGAIHLCALQLGGGDVAPGLDEAERARARRIAQPRRRAQYLGGRAGLRRLLCAYSGLDNAALRLGRGPRGKPKLLNELPGGELRFNYSLSGDWALYAVAWNREVGVDLETWPRAINAEGLAKRVLSAAEWRAWRALPATATAAGRAAAMLAVWTRKEAYGKALGVGIRYAMNRAEVFADAGPRWRCPVAGLFPGEASAARELHGAQLHGVQLAMPFPGIAALVYDGAAAGDDAITGRQTAAAEFSPTQKS